MCRTVAAITVYWTGRFTRNRNLSTAAAASRKVTCLLAAGASRVAEHTSNQGDASARLLRPRLTHSVEPAGALEQDAGTPRLEN